MKKEVKMNKNIRLIAMGVTLLLTTLMACSADSASDEDTEETVVTELHAAFSAFNSDATTIYLDGSNVVIETTGLPNHESVYWGEGNSLYKEESDVDRTPSIMSSNNNATTITVACHWAIIQSKAIGEG